MNLETIERSKRPWWIIRLPADWSWLYVFVCMVWAKDILGEFARAVFMRLPVLGVDDGFPAKWFCYSAALLLALPEIFKSFSFYKILFPLIVGAVYGLTYIVFPENATYLNENVLTFFLATLPMYFLGLAWNVDRMMKPLYYVSVLTLICAVLYRLLISAPMDDEMAEYGGAMSAAYFLLPHLCLIGYYALFGGKKIAWLLLGGGAIYLFTLGNRGSILCLLVFLTALVFFLGSGRKRFTSAIVGATVVVFLSFEKIFYSTLAWLAGVATQFGLSVRIVNKILDGEILDSSSRNLIREALINALNDRQGAWGYGIFGDRVLTRASADYTGGTYAHNLALELWIDFGIIIGTILLGAIAFMIFRRFRICKSRSERAFALLLVCCSVLHLMLSGSYLTHGLFFLFLGVCAQSKNKKGAEATMNLNAPPMFS